MTLDEAIEYYIKVATQRELADEEKGNYEKWNETKFMTKKESEQIIADNRQLAEWLKDYKEAKRLLKSAIDEWNLVCEWGNCGEYCGWYKNGKCTQEWSGKAEALKLIGDD